MNRKTFKNYPDAMSLSQVAECLGISTKLASRLIRSGKLSAVKVGRKDDALKFSMAHTHLHRSFFIL